MAEAPVVLPNKAARPVFGNGLRGRSYLQEHQQYRPPQQDGHQGLDSMVESMQISDYPSLPAPKKSSPVQFNGIPSPSFPPRIIDSGLTHTLSHSNCQPAAGTSSDRVIATLFYKSLSPRLANDLREESPSTRSSSILPSGFAPVRTISNFPLEPPPPDPEPLDHLYGSYISQLCLTSFLAMISSLPLPRSPTGEQVNLTSSHRCLDTPHNPRVVELSFSPAPDPTYVTLSDLRRHELVYRFEREWNVDVIFQPDTILRRYPGLVVFDMDSTLIQQEVIDLLAASIGVEAQVSSITARAMNGEIDFEASLRERCALLKGVDADIFTKLQDVITPNPGAKEVIRALKRMGVKTAVLSGGFIPLTQYLATTLGIDYAYANTLAIDTETSKLTGEVIGTVVDAKRKAALLKEIAEKEGVRLEQTIAVGDGANDLEMMAVAGLGVAFNAKPRVQLEAEARLNGESLADLLFLFGLTAEEVETLLA